jgi:small subunit ribosomal protein S5
MRYTDVKYNLRIKILRAKDNLRREVFRTKEFKRKLKLKTQPIVKRKFELNKSKFKSIGQSKVKSIYQSKFKSKIPKWFKKVRPKPIFKKRYIPRFILKKQRSKRSKYRAKILEIRRVVKIVKGGGIRGFRVTVVVGNKDNKVGLGKGYSESIKLAIDKAIFNAKKEIINVPITSNSSIPYMVKSSYGASSLMLKPSYLGCGIIAGASARSIFELTGIKNIITKQFGAKSIINNAKATIKALRYLNNLILRHKINKYEKNF